MIAVLLVGFLGLAVYGFVARKRWIVLTFAPVPLGLITYYLLGVLAAPILRQSRFYSLPFGGPTVRNNVDLFGSILFWCFAWVGILSVITRRFRQGSQQSRSF